MPWLMTGRDGSSGWHFDAVGLLAIIGEDIITNQAQLITSSIWCFLPRLIPAPQGLLRAERPHRLPGVPGVTVKSIYGGAQVSELNYFANLIHKVDDLKKYDFKVVKITKNEHKDSPQSAQPRADESGFGLQTLDRLGKWKKQAALASKTTRIKTKELSPLNILTILSCFMSIGLLAWACKIGDGVAVLAVISLSVQSTLGCIARYWYPELGERAEDGSEAVPDGDIAIRTRNGAMIIVHCDENVSRQLYIDVDVAEYWLNDAHARPFTGLATALLMVGVILLGNSGWTMQLAIGVAFILLNAAYWLVSLQKKNRLWLVDQAYEVDHPDPKHRIKEINSYTLLLWAAIQETSETKWLRDSGAAPDTEGWDAWLEEAGRNRGNPNWKAFERMTALTAKTSDPNKSQANVQVLPATSPGDPGAGPSSRPTTQHSLQAAAGQQAP